MSRPVYTLAEGSRTIYSNIQFLTLFKASHFEIPPSAPLCQFLVVVASPLWETPFSSRRWLISAGSAFRKGTGTISLPLVLSNSL